MELVSYQRCTQNGPMTEVYVASESSDTIYEVLITDPECPEEAVCDCRAFQYSIDGTCKHQQTAIDSLCYWIEGDEHIQTRSERRNKTCPRCGGDTESVLEYQ